MKWFFILSFLNTIYLTAAEISFKIKSPAIIFDTTQKNIEAARPAALFVTYGCISWPTVSAFGAAPLSHLPNPPHCFAT